MSSTKKKEIPFLSDKPYDFNWDKQLVERKRGGRKTPPG